MSHELRTPMNAILGFAQLMDNDDLVSDDQRENLQQISKAGWHLLDLINEVLDLARVESGEVKLGIESIDAAQLISECLSLVSPLLAQKNIKLENQTTTSTARVRADYMRLKQVLINLLSNAIKYNHNDGQLVVNAVEEAELLVLTVQDNGRGMSASQMERLFEPFSRFGDTEKVYGTGIGLSICKKLIESMNGSIRVDSEEGTGSTFSILLPLGDTVASSPHKQVENLSLLYIEDDAAHRSLFGKWADGQGWGIEFAEDAASGIDAAMKCAYDVILLDIELPNGFTGLDVKAIFDDMESLRNTPVIGISSMVQQQDVDLAMQAGFTAYLTKPIDLPELERVIQRIIRGSREQ
jgi:CheY-like chemotaxis protein/two-component sensor histidine kinase